MGLPKGRTNNKAGRPPGTRNLTTKQAKEVLNGILKQNFTPAKVNRDLKQLEPRQRLEVLTKLLSYVLPRPTEGSLNIGFENLTDEALSHIIDEILNHKNDEKD